MIKKLSNFQQRFLMSILGIALLTVVIFFSHTPPFTYLFVGSVAAVQALSLWEYYNLAERRGISPHKLAGLVFSILYVIFHYLKAHCGLKMGCLPIFLYSFLLVTFVLHFKAHINAIVDVATTIFGFIYITIPLSFLLDINSVNSSLWIVYLLITTKITDTAAYIAGKTLGSRALAPTLSPKKTKEGAIAGLLGASLMSVLFYTVASSIGYTMDFSWLEMAFLGALIGIVAQIGDLAESLLKRDAAVKDSSSMPGFGGMLDIVDSLLFTAPLLFVWLKVKELL
jgi:phosphatidate cytidylyltransferase